MLLTLAFCLLAGISQVGPDGDGFPDRGKYESGYLSLTILPDAWPARVRTIAYEFNQKKQAEKKAVDLSKGGKSPHFVQKVKEVIEE